MHVILKLPIGYNSIFYHTQPDNMDIFVNTHLYIHVQTK